MTNKELRIGNLVYGVSDRIEEVIYILPTEVNTAPPKLKQADFLHKIDEIEPIPLTEEWLEKFGFKITGQTPHPNNIWTVYGEECKFELEHIISFFLYDNKCFGTEVKYVHQLQNLYFALTGEELTFKQD